MSKKSIYLISFVLVLGLTGAAEATFDTVGVYDPDDEPHHNQVDQSGTYDSHTGNAGPENVIDLATFQALIGLAFDADAGGVVDFEDARGSRDGQDIIANFGVSRTKSVTFTDTTGNLSGGSGSSSGNRQPTSGNARLSKGDGTPDWVFDISPVTGGVPGEVVTYVAGTLIYRTNRDLNPQVTATFSGGGTVTAIADMPMWGPANTKDTFFGFVAPPGEGIVNVNFDLTGWTNLDDVAFITSDFVSKEASDPGPADKATDVPRDAVLSWTPGGYASPVNGHTVYLSENFNDVNDGIGGVTQDATSYTPAQLLDYGTTYYWRVDEVSGPPDFTVYKGEVWQLTTELFSYPIQNITATASSQFNENTIPENTINSSGLDANDLHSTKEADIWLSNMAGPQPTWIEYEFDKVYKLHQMWVWNFNQLIEPAVGFGFKEVAIEYSTNGTDWAVLADVPEFAQAPGEDGYAHNTTVDLAGVPAKYVKLTANSNFGGILPQYGISEVRFLHIPVHARNPSPDSGATGVDRDVVLGWRAGRGAVTHDVYLSTDEQAVIDGTVPVATVAETSYGPLSLDLSQTYYWRVDEVNEAETPATWQGDLWDFTTQEYFVVDDFESYNDLNPDDPESNRIFNVWLDGFGIDTNGSLVGHDAAPFAEQTIVHSGKQSMPLSYSNTGGAAYSEAELPLSPPQNWTQAGAATFVLYFHGTEGNTGQLYVKVDGSKVVYGGDAGDIAKAEWTQWNIDLASLGVNLQNVTKLSIGIDGSGATGTLYVDDIRLYPPAPQP